MPLDENTTILLCALYCLPIQLNYSIAYRMVVLFLPILYENIFELSFNRKLTLDANAVNVPIMFFAVFYFLYKCVKLYTFDFIGAGLYPYIFDGI